jgi:hypothetical protein
LPIPRQKVCDLVCGVIRQARQHVGEPSLRINVIKFACLDKGIDRCCSVAPGVGTRKGPVFSSDGNLAAILPISGRMSSSIIAGIHFTDGACVVFRASGAHQVMSCMWSCRPAL